MCLAHQDEERCAYKRHFRGCRASLGKCQCSRTRACQNPYPYRSRNECRADIRGTLQWRHNDHDGVSNHQPHGCLFNRLFRRRSKKTSKLRVTGLCVGNSPGPVNSPHKGPVTRKMFPFDDVIMKEIPPDGHWLEIIQGVQQSGKVSSSLDKVRKKSENFDIRSEKAETIEILEKSSKSRKISYWIPVMK